MGNTKARVTLRLDARGGAGALFKNKLLFESLARVSPIDEEDYDTRS